MKIPPPLSVIVIGRNEERNLARCLESVRAMDYPSDKTELLYVDSDSSDRSVEFAKQYQARIIQLREGAMSPARAREAGWRESSGTFVLFCDGDCAMEPDFVRRSLTELADPRVGCVFGTIREREPDLCFYRRMNHAFWIRVRSYGPGPLIGGTHLWRRDSLEAVGGFDQNLLTMENSDLGQRLSARGLHALYVPYPMAVHDLGRMTFADFLRRAFRNGYGNLLYLFTIRRPWRSLWTNPEARSPMLDALLFLVASLGTLFWFVQRSGWLAPWLGVSLALMVATPMWRARTKTQRLSVLLSYGIHEFVRVPAFLSGQFGFLIDKLRGSTKYPVDWRRSRKP